MSKIVLLTAETRYKFYLELAETVCRFLRYERASKFYRFIKSAFTSAKQNCKPGTGINRAVRHIYFVVLACCGLPPDRPELRRYPEDNQLKYMLNRFLYLRDGRLPHHNFTDWKYYLHYALTKDHEIMIEASKQWPQAGRLIAEWIHSLRATKRNSLAILKIWRKKIDLVPKSGELWCEGGRIYS